jgi:hypothetical protein
MDYTIHASGPAALVLLRGIDIAGFRTDLGP